MLTFVVVAAAFHFFAAAEPTAPVKVAPPPLVLKGTAPIAPNPGAPNAAAAAPSTACAMPDFNARRPFGEREESGVVSLAIKHTACFGTCPVYSFTAHADGKAELVVERFMEPAGKHTGTVATWQFDNLARFAKDSGFMCMNDRYRAMVTDLPTTFVTLTLKDGTSKTIEDYGHIGPSALWALEQLLDDMALRDAKYDDGAHPIPSSKR